MHFKKSTLAERLKTLRGIQSIKEFADLAEVTRDTYRKYEDPDDSTEPKLSTLALICKKTGYDLGYLVTGNALRMVDDKFQRRHNELIYRRDNEPDFNYVIQRLLELSDVEITSVSLAIDAIRRPT